MPPRVITVRYLYGTQGMVSTGDGSKSESGTKESFGEGRAGRRADRGISSSLFRAGVQTGRDGAACSSDGGHPVGRTRGYDAPPRVRATNGLDRVALGAGRVLQVNLGARTFQTRRQATHRRDRAAHQQALRSASPHLPVATSQPRRAGRWSERARVGSLGLLQRAGTLGRQRFHRGN